MMGQLKKKKKNWENEEKKVTLGWKPEKGDLEQKQENFLRLTGRENKRMKGQQPGSIQSLFEVLNPFRNQKIWTFYSKLSQWVSMLDQIIIFRD